MSSEHAEVRKLVDAIAKLVKPLLNKTVEKEVEKVPEVPAPAVVRQWQQGKGVVVVDDLATGVVAVPVPEKAVEKVEKKSVDRLAKMLKDAPKPDKVAQALYGMQVKETERDGDMDRYLDGNMEIGKKFRERNRKKDKNSNRDKDNP